MARRTRFLTSRLGAATVATATALTSALVPVAVAAQEVPTVPAPTVVPSTMPEPPSPVDGSAGEVGDVNVLRSGAEAVRVALADTQARRAAADLALADARAQVIEADAATAAARAEERRAKTRADRLDRQVADAAVESFVGDQGDQLMAVLFSADFEDASWASMVVRYQADLFSELLDRQERAAAQLTRRRSERVAASQRAAAAEQEANRLVGELDALAADQAQFVGLVDERLDRALAEAAALEAIDAAAAAELAAQEQDLRNAVALAVTISDVVPAGATATTLPSVPAPDPGRPTTPRPTAPPTTRTPAPTTVPPSTSRPDVVSVNGIVVARSISVSFANLLTEAAAAGVILGGSGYRDINRQIELRMAHCGTSYEAIWLVSSSACSPPTARPGTSMHERGLAVDLTCAGSLIRSRSSGCFVWLNQNASRFGLYNLPSEPWHWSTTGG